MRLVTTAPALALVLAAGFLTPAALGPAAPPPVALPRRVRAMASRRALTAGLDVRD